jgi:hypothetical protein
MKRREVLKMMAALASTLPLSQSAWGLGHQSKGNILVDAVNFSDKGGWLVDPQFIEQMGNPYLLAHGMGRPVKNASTTIKVPEEGTYYLWARTKDWCPGEWKSPGRFQILLNGKTDKTEFGGHKKDWGWQRGHSVNLKKGDVKLQLKDLTGFDGRCDAIFLTLDKNFVPPSKAPVLANWRTAIHKLEKRPSKDLTFDVVIVGGGMSGCAAAIAASEQGMKVALVHNRPILGGNASSEVRVHAIGIRGKGSRIIKQIDTEHWPNGSIKALDDDKKRHMNMDKHKGIKQFLNWSVYAVETKDNRIVSVDARSNTSHDRMRVRGPVFIDASGDGVMGFKAGAKFRYGRESKHKYGEAQDKYGDLWSPEKPDGRVMGTSVMWRREIMEEEVEFPEVPWAMPVAKDLASPKSEWYWEYSAEHLHQIHDAEIIRDHMFRAAYGNFFNLKKHPGRAKMQLKWVAHIGGKRESRRFMGDHILVQDDILDSVLFPDRVVEEKRAIDLHYQRVRKGDKVDFLSKAVYIKPKNHGLYYVPFRCLYSKNIENMMMAGRCFSCSHVALGGPRVMLTCAQMGIATGFAASLCVKNKKDPRAVGKDHIKELRALIGYTDV